MSETTPAKTATLAKVLSDLEHRLPEYREALKQRNVVEALQTRQDELSEPENLLKSVHASRELLSSTGFKGFSDEAKRQLQRLKAKVDRIRQQVAVDVAQLARAGAVDANELTQAAEALETELHEYWSGYAAKDLPADEVLAVFDKHQSYKATISGVRLLKQQLQTLGKVLPAVAADVQKVKQLRDQAINKFASLPQLEDKHKKFLLESAAGGCVLKKLLEDAELLQWVKEQKLDEGLRVTSSQL